MIYITWQIPDHTLVDIYQVVIKVVSQQRSTWHHHGSHEFAAPLQPDRRKNDSHALTHWLVASPGTCKSSWVGNTLHWLHVINARTYNIYTHTHTHISLSRSYLLSSLYYMPSMQLSGYVICCKGHIILLDGSIYYSWQYVHLLCSMLVVRNSMKMEVYNVNTHACRCLSTQKLVALCSFPSISLFSILTFYTTYLKADDMHHGSKMNKQGSCAVFDSPEKRISCYSFKLNDVYKHDWKKHGGHFGVENHDGIHAWPIFKHTCANMWREDMKCAIWQTIIHHPLFQETILCYHHQLVHVVDKEIRMTINDEKKEMGIVAAVAVSKRLLLWYQHVK